MQWYVKLLTTELQLGLTKVVQGEENIGMAMTFTLVSHLREQLSELVRTRDERKKKVEAEKERKALEVTTAEHFL